MKGRQGQGAQRRCEHPTEGQAIGDGDPALPRDTQPRDPARGETPSPNRPGRSPQALLSRPPGRGWLGAGALLCQGSGAGVPQTSPPGFIRC